MLIKIESFSKTIKGTKLLQDINLEFSSGKIYGIVGKNGSGKTMFLRAIAGLIRPTKGQITINQKLLHKDISFPPSMGLLIEKPEFLSYITGFENLKMLAEINKVIFRQQIKDYMNMFGIDPNLKLPIKKYSLGMKQKIGVIQSIMENPELLILDEPFNALDEDTVNMLRKLFLQYKEEGKLIILTSHNKEDLDILCDHIYCIKNGKLELLNNELKHL